MDIISMAWDILNGFGVGPYSAVIFIIVLGCCVLLIREYGKTFRAHLFHRRNLLSVCGVAFFFCVFWVLIRQGSFKNFPVWLRGLLLIQYIAYIIVVLRSVKKPTLFARRHLEKCRTWLKQGEAREHSACVAKMPWYFLDQNEKLEFKILRAKYLFEQGALIDSYNLFQSIDRRILYPEEQSELDHSLAFLLIQQGSLTKAEEVVKRLETSDPPDGYTLDSFLAELQGDLDRAFDLAYRGENAIPQGYKNHSVLIELYTHLGRLCSFRDNRSELFRYYRMALEEAKKYGDLRIYHVTYQNLLGQIRRCNMHEEAFEPLMREYSSVMAGTSLNNQMELENFQISIARQKDDRQKEFEAIRDGYARLHAVAGPADQCMVEVSTMRMLCNGNFPVDCVLGDVKAHFDSYFELPLAARIKAVQDFPIPYPRSPEEAVLFDSWINQLSAYAKGQAMEDLTQYEQTLSSDNVNERCWAMRQRIDFIRRTQGQYDGQKMLRLMRDIVQIYEGSGQLARKIEAEVNIVREYDELIFLGRLQLNEETLRIMRQIIDTAYSECLRIPNAAVSAPLIDIAYYSLRLGNLDQAESAFQRFEDSGAPPTQFSQEQQAKYTWLIQNLQV